MPPPSRAKIEISEPPNARPTSECSDVVVVAEHVEHQPVVGRHAEQAEAHDQHAGDGAAAERDLQRRVEAHAGRVRGADVGAHRHVHADVARRAREDGADREAAGGRPVEREAEDHEQHHADDADGGVLAVQVGVGALLDRRGDFLHARIAGRLRHDPACREHTVDDGEHAGADRQPQREISGHCKPPNEDSSWFMSRPGGALRPLSCRQKRRGTIPQRPVSASSAPACSSAPRTGAARPCTAGSPRP